MMMNKKNISNKLTEPKLVRWLLTASAIIFLIIFLLFPLLAIFQEAFSLGIDVYLSAITDPEAIEAIELTLIATFFSLTFNLLFGLAAAWAITKFDFKGK